MRRLHLLAPTLFACACSLPAKPVETTPVPLPPEPASCPYPVVRPSEAAPGEAERNPIHAFDADGTVGTMAFECVRLGTLPVPSGRLALYDPQVSGLVDVDVLEVPKGAHELWIARRPTPPMDDHGLVGENAVAYALVRLSDERPVAWGNGFEGEPVSPNYRAGPWPEQGCCAVLFDPSFQPTVRAELGDEKRYPRRTFRFEDSADDNRRARAGEFTLSWKDAQLRRGDDQGYYVQHRMGRNVMRYLGFDANGKLAAIVLDAGLVTPLALADDVQGVPKSIGHATCPAATTRELPRVDCPFARDVAGDPRMFGEPGGCLSVGELGLPTGRLIVDDPLAGAASVPLPIEIPPGRFPVYVRTKGPPGVEEHQGAVVVLASGTPVRWKKVWQYGVDSGNSAFMALSAHQAAQQRDHESIGFSSDSPLLDAASKRPITCVEVDPVSGANYVIFSSGAGDGVYDVLIGYGAKGEVIAVATEFDT